MKKRRTVSAAGRLTALFLSLVLVTGAAPVSARAAGGENSHFKDVPATHWASPYVERAYADGAIAGTGGDPAKGTGTFSPDSKVTYGQFLVLLTGAFYAGEVAQARQAGDLWYAPAFRVALEHKLTYIDYDRLMSYANSTINRYNAAYIIVRLLEDQGAYLPSQQERDAAAAQTGDWEAVGRDAAAWPRYVSTVVAAGVMTGVDDKGTFAGHDTIYRSSAAVIYTRLADKLPQFHIFQGEGWELAASPDCWEEVQDAFYTFYPRMWARWGGGEIQKSISVNVKPQLLIKEGEYAAMWTRFIRFDQEKQLWERDIEISAASTARSAYGAFTHELGHVVEGYKNFKGTWWGETFASYASFRYYYYADEAAFQRSLAVYIHPDDPKLRSWHFDHNHYSYWFYAYMDSKYPTTPQGYGLLDSLHFAMRSGEITSDDPDDPNLNAVVQRVTGYSTIEQLRQQYVRELDAGTWTFNGFAGYQDNYITENLPGVPNPTYITGENLNLCAGARTYSVSGQASDRYAANNLVDGDRSTKWQAAPGDADRSKLSCDVQHGLCITLNKALTFDTYVLCHEGSNGNSAQNTVSWRLRYYDTEAEKWYTVDTVTDNSEDVTVRKIAPVRAQNLHLEILNASGNGDGTVRLYELELFNKGE